MSIGKLKVPFTKLPPEHMFNVFESKRYSQKSDGSSRDSSI
jgi:hypothetical protein